MESTNCDQYCVFHFDENWFAMLATTIREVMPTPEIVSLPNSSRNLLGLCHVRNEFIPVVELSDDAHRINSRKQMMIIAGTSGIWGWLVDQVVGLSSLDFSMGPSGDTNALISPAIMGTAAYDGKIIRVLDVNAVYRQIEKELSNHWQETFCTN